MLKEDMSKLTQEDLDGTSGPELNVCYPTPKLAVGQRVKVCFPGKQEHYLGTITYVSNYWHVRYTVQANYFVTTDHNHPDFPFKKIETELRVVETFPTLIETMEYNVVEVD